MPSLFFEKQDIGRIRLGGRLALKDFELKDTAKNFNFLGNADLKFSDSETLQAELEIREILLNSRKLSSEIDRMKAKVVSTNPQDTTKIVTLQCELEMNKLRANIGDSLKYIVARLLELANLLRRNKIRRCR